MSQAPSPRMIRRAGTALLIGVIVFVALAILLLSFDRPLVRRADPQTDDAYVGGDTTPLSMREPGYLRLLPIADNQPVRMGELIAQIEDDDYQAQQAQAQARLATAESRLVGLDARLRENAEQSARSRADEAAAIADTSNTLPEYRRQLRLLGTDLGLPRALDQARAEQQRADADIAAGRAMIVVRQRQADALAAQRMQQAAMVRAMRADLRLASIHLSWTRLRAPVSGTLGIRQVRVGDLLAAGSQVVTLTPLDAVWVDANFTERQITDIRIGQPARIVLDAFPDHPLSGHVGGLSPTTGAALSAVPPDNTTGNFTKVVQRVPVRLVIDWNGSPLRGRVLPGMSAVATVRTAATGAVSAGDARARAPLARTKLLASSLTVQ